MSLGSSAIVHVFDHFLQNAKKRFDERGIVVRNPRLPGVPFTNTAPFMNHRHAATLAMTRWLAIRDLWTERVHGAMREVGIFFAFQGSFGSAAPYAQSGVLTARPSLTTVFRFDVQLPVRSVVAAVISNVFIENMSVSRNDRLQLNFEWEAPVDRHMISDIRRIPGIWRELDRDPRDQAIISNLYTRIVEAPGPWTSYRKFQMLLVVWIAQVIVFLLNEKRVRRYRPAHMLYEVIFAAFEYNSNILAGLSVDINQDDETLTVFVDHQVALDTMKVHPLGRFIREYIENWGQAPESRIFSFMDMCTLPLADQ
jgi:hypothetical protein